MLEKMLIVIGTFAPGGFIILASIALIKLIKHYKGKKNDSTRNS